jgi:diguanylate cyclase
MSASPPPTTAAPGPFRRWRLLAWAAAASLIFGGLMLNQPVDNALRTMRSNLFPVRASGDIVIVGVDEKSLAQLGEWPWNRQRLAEIVDRVRQGGATRLFIDFAVDAPTRPEDDRVFRDALHRFGKVVLPARDGVEILQQKQSTFHGEPLKMFRDVASVASITASYNYQHAVWQLPYNSSHSPIDRQGFSAAMAEVQPVDPSRPRFFRLLYSIDPLSIPTVSVVDLLAGRVSPDRLRGKQVVLAPIADSLNDQYWVPGRGKMPGAYVLIIGAETLRRGTPMDFGWLALLGLTMGLLAIALRPSLKHRSGILLPAWIAILLIAPGPLELNLISFDIAPSLLAVGVVAARLGWLRWQARGLVDDVSGLPNLTALRGESEQRDQVLIVTRVRNYAAITSTLAPGEEKELILQIVDRLTLANVDHRIYQGDEGIFAWFAGSSAVVGNHLEAMHALFRSPLVVGGRAVDLAVSFGADLGSAGSIGNRLASSLVAADEAWVEGLKWKYHDPARLEEVKWRLSLLGELDSAIDNGEVWLAYQPQMDLGTGQIIGAEALARWTHPTKGPIGPAEFVAAAEANGRIGKLTDFVLDRAIITAAAINRRGAPFTVAVNLSARLLSDRAWLERVAHLLKVHGLDPARLTLELTESAALDERDGGLALLDAFRALGIRIALDDYGTGLSTLEYLKKVPAHEIKLDQSFIKAMRVNRGDMLMVQSTIALAHSLGRTVVAEGVEDRESLEDLRAMGCDVAQGFVIGRPLGVRELVQRLDVTGDRKVA